jgi:tRNA (cmo5U34)-methyltransferase
MTASPNINLWTSAEHALDYLRRADSIPHRIEGEATLLECLPENPARVLDLGSGAGRLLNLAKTARPQAEFVAVDFSPTMLAELKTQFQSDTRVSVVAHDLNDPLPDLGRFDLVVSSFAIHHLPHDRKRTLYEEVFSCLNASGIFCNLEHVASATLNLHHAFLATLDIEPAAEDPSNKLLDLELQLSWLREIGFTDVDCLWKWRELALLVGTKSE